MSRAAEVAEVLRRIAFAGELMGQNPMRIRAFTNGARVVKKLGSELEGAYASGELAAMKGIGKGLLAVIGQVLANEPVPALEKLEAEVPPGLFEARRISGLGAKRLLTLWKDLNLVSVADIEYACNENRLIELAGCGPKTQDKVLASIAELRARSAVVRLDRGIRIAEALATQISQLGFRAEIVGDVARGRESVDGVEILVLCGSDAELKLEAREDSVAVAIHRVSDPKAFGPALIRHTADQAHVEALVTRGLEGVGGEDASEVYAQLGLHAVAPERRIGKTSLVDASQPAPDRLVTRQDLLGALHNHTTASDGVHELDQMVAAAEAAGLRYLGLAEHSQSAGYAGGLSTGALLAQHERVVARRNQGGGPCTVLSGVESDIADDGGLDYPDEVLAQLDVVVASVHGRLRMSRDAMTARMLGAVRQRCCDIVGHPTGRLIGGRAGSDFDMDAFLDACAEHQVAVELNANPMRLDLGAEALEAAKCRGVLVSIAADAHSTAALAHLDLGVRVARRAGLTPADVLNARPFHDVQKWVKARRG